MRYLLWLVGVPVVVVMIVGASLERDLRFETEPRLTVAYSSAQARYLGLDPNRVLGAIVTDLHPEHFRFQANWNEIEPQPGEFDFLELDSFIAAARGIGATVTLAVGRKLPRWPECHDPDWLMGLSLTEIEERHFAMVRTVVERYRSEPVVVRWQVENEPLFAYGACLAPNQHRLVREVALVRALDPTRPILLTDSGELGSWWETARLTDEQGTTLYRVTWNPLLRYFSYPWPPYYYRFKAALISPFVQQTVVSELQMEPWAPLGTKALELAEAQRSFSLERFHENLDFFRGTGLPEAMLWGVEWWYYARETLGEPGYWEAARVEFGRE